MALALASIQRQRSTLHASRSTLHTSRSTLLSPLRGVGGVQGSGVRLRFPCLQFAKIKVFIVK